MRQLTLKLISEEREKERLASEELLRFVEHEVEQLVVALESAGHLAAAGELDLDALVDELGEVQNRLLPS